MDGLDCRHQTSDLNQTFPSMAILILCVSSDFTFSNTHKIINTDTCMPRGGPNYKAFSFAPNYTTDISPITFFSSTTYQPTYLLKWGITFFWRYIPKVSYKSSIPQAAFAGSRSFLPSAGDAVRGRGCHFAPQRVTSKPPIFNIVAATPSPMFCS